MKIDAENCIGCGTCIDYCNVGAISIEDEVASIYQDLCVEFWVCYRNQVCPSDCSEPTPFKHYGEVYKHVLSDSTETSKGTGIPGRGTEGEESKTKDVNGRNAQLYEKGRCQYHIHICKLAGMGPSSVF